MELMEGMEVINNDFAHACFGMFEEDSGEERNIADAEGIWNTMEQEVKVEFIDYWEKDE